MMVSSAQCSLSTILNIPSLPFQSSLFSLASEPQYRLVVSVQSLQLPSLAYIHPILLPWTLVTCILSSLALCLHIYTWYISGANYWCYPAITAENSKQQVLGTSAWDNYLPTLPIIDKHFNYYTYNFTVWVYLTFYLQYGLQGEGD